MVLYILAFDQLRIKVFYNNISAFSYVVLNFGELMIILTMTTTSSALTNFAGVKLTSVGSCYFRGKLPKHIDV